MTKPFASARLSLPAFVLGAFIACGPDGSEPLGPTSRAAAPPLPGAAGAGPSTVEHGTESNPNGSTPDASAPGPTTPPGPIDMSFLPADRTTRWLPGMMALGGIPNRTTVCAKLSPSGGNDSAAIQAKLDACPSGQVVELSAGTFVVNDYLLIHRDVTLRGAGAGVTILKKANGAPARSSTIASGTVHAPIEGNVTWDPQPIVIIGPARWTGFDNRTSRDLTIDAQKGALSVTVADASGFAAGQFVLIDEKSGASWQPSPQGYPDGAQVWQGDRVAWNMHFPHQQWIDDSPAADATGPYEGSPGTPPSSMGWFMRMDRPTSEMKEVESVTGNTLTFTSPLTIGYRANHQAQVTRATDTSEYGNNVHVVNAGVESLSMIGGADGALRFQNAARSWAKNVEITEWIGEGIGLVASFRIEIRDSYVHTASYPVPGGGAYAFSAATGSSEILLENNILVDANKQMVFRSCGAGSVVAYNYGDDSWIDYSRGWVEVGMNASHMAGPHHVLFEGNYSQNYDSDFTHGNAIYMTVFRNWFSGKRRDFTDAANVRAIGLGYGSWWHSFVGNVLGRPNEMSGWRYTVPAMSCDSAGNNCTGSSHDWSDPDIWKLGYDQWSANPDPKVLSTVIRDGNFDFVTSSQRFHDTPAGFSIPSSLYLTAKPSFFGANEWPWVNPATGVVHQLPAKARFEAGTPNVVP